MDRMRLHVMLRQPLMKFLHSTPSNDDLQEEPEQTTNNNEPADVDLLETELDIIENTNSDTSTSTQDQEKNNDPISTTPDLLSDSLQFSETTLPDPQFCPDGTTPAEGTGTCGAQHVGATAIASAIADASASGTIYLEEGAIFTETINLSNQNTNLTFSGGWSFINDNQGTTTTLNAPIYITDSLGTITFQNIIFGVNAIFSVDNSPYVIINGTSGNDAIQIDFVGSGTSGITANDGGGTSDTFNRKRNKWC